MTETPGDAIRRYMSQSFEDTKDLARDQRMSYEPGDSKFRRIQLEKIRLEYCALFDVRVEHTVAAYDHLKNVMRHQFATYVMGLTDREIDIYRQWPCDWVQSIKHRWAPQWWKSRWPVKYESVTVRETIYKAVCPHLTCDGEDQCVHWLFGEVGE